MIIHIHQRRVVNLSEIQQLHISKLISVSPLSNNGIGIVNNGVVGGGDYDNDTMIQIICNNNNYNPMKNNNNPIIHNNLGQQYRWTVPNNYPNTNVINNNNNNQNNIDPRRQQQDFKKIDVADDDQSL